MVQQKDPGHLGSNDVNMDRTEEESRYVGI